MQGGLALIPGQGTKIPQCSQKKKKKMLCQLQMSVVTVLTHGDRELRVLLTEDLLCAGNFTIVFHAYCFMIISYFKFI